MTFNLIAVGTACCAAAFVYGWGGAYASASVVIWYCVGYAQGFFRPKGGAA